MRLFIYFQIKSVPIIAKLSLNFRRSKRNVAYWPSPSSLTSSMISFNTATPSKHFKMKEMWAKLKKTSDKYRDIYLPSIFLSKFNQIFLCFFAKVEMVPKFTVSLWTSNETYFSHNFLQSNYFYIHIEIHLFCQCTLHFLSSFRIHSHL